MDATLQSTITALCKRHRVDAIYVFGSRAQEVLQYLQQREPTLLSHGESDVDIGILPQAGVTFGYRETARLMAELEDVLGVGHVDLVILPDVSTFLALEVIKGELVFDAHPDRTAEYELEVLRRAGDLAHFERERIHLILTDEAL